GLLEVGELRDLEAVEEHLPADAPRAERRRLPVVLLEADVVLARVDPARLEALQVDLLHVVGRRFQHDLKLMVLEQPVRIFAEAAVGGPPRRLHVRDVPVRRPEHPQERLRVHRAGADLDVERLLQRAAARGPEFRQLQNQVLKRHRRSSRSTRTDFRSFSRCMPINSRCAASSSRSARAGTCTWPSANGLDARARSRNAFASDDSRASGSYTPCSRRSQYSKYRARGSTGTPAASAATIETPRRNSVSLGSASCAHSSISSAK